MKPNILQKWEKQHKQEILKELQQANIRLTKENIPEIINETSFKTRSKKHPNKCPYYSKGESCHPEIKDLNCMLCACPNYMSKTEIGGCKINSRFGKFHNHPSLPKGKVWDCSDCNKYHSPQSVEKFLRKHLQD